jgi:hypothetical protein
MVRGSGIVQDPREFDRVRSVKPDDPDPYGLLRISGPRILALSGERNGNEYRHYQDDPLHVHLLAGCFQPCFRIQTIAVSTKQECHGLHGFH